MTTDDKADRYGIKELNETAANAIGELGIKMFRVMAERSGATNLEQEDGVYITASALKLVEASAREAIRDQLHRDDPNFLVCAAMERVAYLAEKCRKEAPEVQIGHA